MKRRGERGMSWGEGRLLAAALLLVLALSLFAQLRARPPERFAPPLHSADPRALEAAEKIDLNAADSEALQALPGIGPALAGRIIAYRSAHGPFQSLDELLEVEGIGEETLAQIRPMLRIG